jgi:hypothetical protein
MTLSGCKFCVIYKLKLLKTFVIIYLQLEIDPHDFTSTSYCFEIVNNHSKHVLKCQVNLSLWLTWEQVNPAPSQPGPSQPVLKIGQPGPKIGQSGPTVFLFGQPGPKIGQCGPKIGHSGPKIYFSKKTI